MKPLSCLLFDANIIIYLFELGIWDVVVAGCDLQIARTVVQEAQFYVRDGRQETIDLEPYVTDGRIHVFDATPADMAAFRGQFDAEYLERLDPGETECLAYLLLASSEHLLCSADAIVYRVLGNLDRGEQGISLEEILAKLGRSRKIRPQFTKDFRKRCTQEGVTARLQGRGLKQAR